VQKDSKHFRKTLNTSEALTTSLSLFSPTVCFVSFIKLKRKLKFRNNKKKFLQLATNLENSAVPKLGKRQAPSTTSESTWSSPDRYYAFFSTFPRSSRPSQRRHQAAATATRAARSWWAAMASLQLRCASKKPQKKKAPSRRDSASWFALVLCVFSPSWRKPPPSQA